MPFTLAHPAAVLPLIRGPFGRIAIPSALVVGSCAPDLSYFVAWPLAKADSHSLPGLITFCLPLGLAAFGFFHVLVAPLFMDLAMNPLRARLPDRWLEGRCPKGSIVALALSLIAGAITHIVWDSFTHASRGLFGTFEILSRPLADVGGYTIYGYKILQHGSTLLGVSALALWGLRKYATAHIAKRPAPPPWKTRAALLALILIPPVVTGFLGGMSSSFSLDEPVEAFRQFVGGAIYPGGSTFLVSLSVVAAARRLLMLTRAL